MKKIYAIVKMFFCVFSMLILVFSSISSAKRNTNNMEPLVYSQQEKQIATAIKNNSYNEAINLYLNNGMSEQVRNLLNNYGYARINVLTGINQSRERYSGDFLFPVYDFENAVIFSQVGMRKYNKRTYANYGVGGEYFYDYLKVSSNINK